MSCECHSSEVEHAAWEVQAKVIHLAQYEAERRTGMAYHCPACIREARGELAAESCYACPSGRHRACEYHA